MTVKTDTATEARRFAATEAVKVRIARAHLSECKGCEHDSDWRLWLAQQEAA